MLRTGWVQILIGLLLLWGSFAGLALTRLAPLSLLSVSSLGLAQRDDDDDDERPRDRERREREQRERRQPELFRSLLRELRLGNIWVVQQGGRQQALRVGLEYQGRTIAAITLNPRTGQPVAYESRKTSIPTHPLTQTHLRTYLDTLRTQASQITFGAFGLPSTGAVQFPIYWNNQLVSYVRFNTAQGQVLPDSVSIAEILTSPLKLR